MALNIKNERAERLAHELADATGVSLTAAVIQALEYRLGKVQRAAVRETLRADVQAIQDFVKSQPDRDTRSADDILGYDDFGLPR